jgi:hypothetical protein
MWFWDRWVLWPYASMADTLPVGRDALGRLLMLVFQRGRLVGGKTPGSRDCCAGGENAASRRVPVARRGWPGSSIREQRTAIRLHGITRGLS